MKITEKIISIPPYLSTSWEQVEAIHMQGGELVFRLKDKTEVCVPHLSPDAIEAIFSAHAIFLERRLSRRTAGPRGPEEGQKRGSLQGPLAEQVLPLFRFGITSLDAVGQALQHNPAFSDLPPIPPEVAEKIAAVAKVLSPEDIEAMPSDEPDCNCLFCQITRILKMTLGHGTRLVPEHLIQESEEEEVKEEDLRFEEWNVQEIGDKLYLVTNKLDSLEQYNVYLGEPIGCTCGKPHCEHVVAVLRH